jgi:hypothetical protein
LNSVSDTLQHRRIQFVGNPRTLRQDIVNLYIFHDRPPLCPFLNPAALIVSLNFLYALCTFCFTDPTLDEVARATSSNDIPATFSIAITSRWLSDSGANSAIRPSP